MYIRIYISPGTPSFNSQLVTTGWRRLIGSPKLQIVFHKRAIKYRSLLRKMTYKAKGSYESSHPIHMLYKKTEELIFENLYRVAKIWCLKLQVSFHRRATNHRVLLRKMQNQDNCRFLSAKEPLIIGFFCGKWPAKIRHPMHRRHPVSVVVEFLKHYLGTKFTIQHTWIADF